MKSRLTSLVLAAAVTAGGVWFGVDALGGEEPIVAPGQSMEGARDGLWAELRQARLAADVAALDRFVSARQSEAADSEDPDAWTILAASFLERTLFRDRNKGMRVGKTTYSDALPEANAADIKSGLEAADRAIALGVTDGDLYRIQAALMSIRAVGWTQAVASRSAVGAAMEKAHELSPDHPRLLMAEATEKLFTPRWLGGDPRGARDVFVQCAEALPDDDRPHLYAAMASWLIEEREPALEHLRAALARNPNGDYAREVMRRIEADEDEPFGRDV